MAVQQEEEQVRLALQRIPVHFQTILELSYWDEVSNADLAQILEIDPTTVRTRLFRAFFKQKTAYEISHRSRHSC